MLKYMKTCKFFNIENDLEVFNFENGNDFFGVSMLFIEVFSYSNSLGVYI